MRRSPLFPRPVRAGSVFVAFLAACRAPEPVEDPPRAADPPTQSDDLPLTLEVTYVPNHLAALGTVRMADASGELAIAYGPVGGALDRRTPGVAVGPGQRVEVPVLGLSPGEWSVAAVFDGEVGAPWTVTTSLPDGVSAGEITVPAATPDDDLVVCAALRLPHGYLCVDQQGTAQAYVALVAAPMFVRPLADGDWLVHPREPGPLLHIDRLGRIQRAWRLEDLRGLRFVHDTFDGHDVVEVTEGPWAGAWAVLTLTEDEGLEGVGIVVFDPADGTVRWDWSSHGALGDGRSIDPERLSYDRISTDPDFPEEWHHANALVHGRHDDVDHFWVSLRHQDWVIRVDTDTDAVGVRVGHEGDVTLLDGEGGEPARASEWMYHQHAPQWAQRSDGTLEMLVVDNGNNRPVSRPYSRLARFVFTADLETGWVDWAYGGPPPSEEYFLLETAGDIDGAGPEGVRYTHHDDDGWVTQVGWEADIQWEWRLPGRGELYRTEAYTSIYGAAIP